MHEAGVTERLNLLPHDTLTPGNASPFVNESLPLVMIEFGDHLGESAQKRCTKRHVDRRTLIELRECSPERRMRGSVITSGRIDPPFQFDRSHGHYVRVRTNRAQRRPGFVVTLV